MKRVIPMLAAGLIGAGFLATATRTVAADEPAVAAPAPAPAAEPAPAPEAQPRRGFQNRGDMLKEADTNGDGQISLEEFLANSDKRARERFKEMDRNADGFLVAEEMRGPRGNGEGRGRPQRQGGGQPGANE